MCVYLFPSFLLKTVSNFIALITRVSLHLTIKPLNKCNRQLKKKKSFVNIDITDRIFEFNSVIVS